MTRAAGVGCLLCAALTSGCILDRSGTARDGATPPGVDAGPGFDAGGFDGGPDYDAGPRPDAGHDAGFDAGTDAGFDAGVDSAVPIPDACVPSAETCDGFDQDCDGIIDDGLTRSCTTSCGTGTDTCIMGTWFCDVREPTPETCDGFDQDCDGVIDDGLTRACSNSCGSGIETCLSGVYTGCTAPTPTTEVCDNVDNDCNGMVDDLPPRPCTVSGGCGAVTGTETCAGGVWTCSAMGITEACNGRDDDCNGIIDDGAACPCPVRHYGGHAYMFCATPNSWTGGLAACRASSYELVTINDAGENTFVTDAALTDRNDDWWIGISDQAMEGTWVWAYGTSSYTHWDPGEPGNYMAGSFDCGNIENGSDGTEARTWWADRPCSNTRPYVCETR